MYVLDNRAKHYGTRDSLLLIVPNSSSSMALSCTTNIKLRHVSQILSFFLTIESGPQMRDDKVLLKAYSQAITKPNLGTRTGARTKARSQPIPRCKPELVEALSDTPHINPP